MNGGWRGGLQAGWPAAPGFAMLAAMALRTDSFTGTAIQPHLGALAALRIAVFREWPYLYQGDEAYEADYLAAYAKSADSVFVLAFDGDEVVGAATGIPLADETDAFVQPVREQGLAPGQVFYFGESVLLPQYRGQGVGHRFFDGREAHARALGGFRFTAFCAVQRELGDPRQPQDYRPLDGFWRKRGYSPVEGMVAELEWLETFHEAPTMHRLQFWMRDWGP